MQVNNNSPVIRHSAGRYFSGMYIWLPAGCIAVFSLFLFLLINGCSSSSSSPSSSSISGKLTVINAGSGADAQGNRMSLRPLSIQNASVSAMEPSAQPSKFLCADFVPDEIIVKYRPGISPASAAGSVTESGYSVLKTSTHTGDGVLTLMKLKASQKALLTSDALRERTLLEIKRLNALPAVEYAQPNYIYKPLSTPNDTLYENQWHYPLIKMDHVWNEGLVNDVSDIIVAVIDTGIARSDGTKSGTNHPDLEGIFVDEYDFISDTAISLDDDGIDDDATDPGDDGQYSSFHGTHVAGTIGALTNNGMGVAGIAGGSLSTNVKIMPLRVLGKGGGTTYDIAEAIKYAAGLQNASQTLPSQKADIINMSLGSPGSDDQVLRDAIIDAYNKGVLIIAASGNDGTDIPYYPAAYDNVISVAAVDIGADVAYYSSYGNTIDIAAPGGNFALDFNLDDNPDGILSTFAKYNGPGKYDLDGVYYFSQGTSMATPHITGVAALVKHALINAGNPNAPDDIKDILLNNAIDLGATGRDDYYGYGLVNAYASVKAALNHNRGPVLFAFPKKLKLEGLNPEGGFILKNIGNPSSITINNITKKNSSQWISVSYQGNTAEAYNGLQVDVLIDTNTYSFITDGGTYTETLEIAWSEVSDSGTEYVYILYNKGDVYVVAIDPETYNILKTVVTNETYNYEYTIEDLETGNYIIGASTDLDNDGNILVSGELFGCYQNIIEFHKGDNLTNINFDITDKTSSNNIF